MNNSSKVAEIYRNAGEAFIILSEIMDKMELEDDASDYTDQEIALLQVAVANFSIELADVSTLVKNRRLLERAKEITKKSSHSSKSKKGEDSSKKSSRRHPSYESPETNQPKGDREFKRKHEDDVEIVEKSTSVPKKLSLSPAKASSKDERSSKDPTFYASKHARTASLPTASTPVSTAILSNVPRLPNATNLPAKNQSAQPIRINHGNTSGSNHGNTSGSNHGNTSGSNQVTSQGSTSPIKFLGGSTLRLQSGQAIKLMPGQSVRLPSGQIIKAHAISTSTLRAPYQSPQTLQGTTSFSPQNVADGQRRVASMGSAAAKPFAKGPTLKNV